MAVITTSTLSSQLQALLSKQMIQGLKNTLQLEQFANRSSLPKAAGKNSISFFRRPTASATNVQSLVEGTAISTFRTYAYTKVDCGLSQYGEAAQISDIMLATELLDNMQNLTITFGEEAALKADTVCRDQLASSTGLTARYSGGATDITTLNNLDTNAGRLTVTDMLDGATALRIALAPTVKGSYNAVLAPQTARDVVQDSQWLNAKYYSDVKDLYSGEIGEIFGVRCVWGTNPFRESSSSGLGVYDAAGTMYTTFILGRDAFGVPALAGDSPWSPSIMMVTKPDSGNPLLQYVTAGWKLWYGCTTLVNTSGIALRSKTLYA